MKEINNAKIPRDQLDTYFEYGVDIVNRSIFLNEITETNVAQVIKGLYLMNQDSNHKPIELRICSYGGDVYDMFGLHDVARTLKSPVHVYGIGKIMSAAILLIACGTKGKRWAGENTSFMVHVPSWPSPDLTLHDHKIDVEEGKRLWDNWYKLMAKYTKKDEKFWRRMCGKRVDVYFDAYKAQEWGLIDHIWDGG